MNRCKALYIKFKDIKQHMKSIYIRILFVFGVVLLCTNTIYAGKNEISEFQMNSAKSRGGIVFGGALGLSFGNYTMVNISPQVGYAFNHKFTLGGGVAYNYYSYSLSDLTLSYLGLNVYARYNPVRYVNLQIQPEIYGRWGREDGKNISSDYVPVLLVGAGGIIPVTPHSGIMVMLYYDVLQNEKTPYGGQLFYTIGYTFRF